MSEEVIQFFGIYDDSLQTMFVRFIFISPSCKNACRHLLQNQLQELPMYASEEKKLVPGYSDSRLLFTPMMNLSN